MTKTLRELSNEVSDEDLETVERLLFGEFNHALEKQNDGLEMHDTIAQLESAMEAVTLIRKTLDEERTQRVKRTAEAVEDGLSATRD